MSEQLTVTELLAIFDRPSVDARWLACADSTEYLDIVTYLVQRSNRGRA